MQLAICAGFGSRRARTAKRLILGSHIDTVPNAGAFDGVLGVALALEWVELAQELKLPLPIEVIAFSEEEGVRFGVPFIGSRAVAGRFDPALLALKDADGVTLADAIRAFGLDPGQIGDAALDADVLGFVEMHIEQGPGLESEGLSVAAVTAIVGQTRLSLEFTGQANHAGTTPMHLRHDALAGAAEWISAVESARTEHRRTDRHRRQNRRRTQRSQRDCRSRAREPRCPPCGRPRAQCRRGISSCASASHRCETRTQLSNRTRKWISPPCPWMSG